MERLVLFSFFLLFSMEAFSKRPSPFLGENQKADWHVGRYIKPFPKVYRPEISYWIHIFTKSKSLYAKTWLKRSNRYFPLMQSIFSQRGLPKELVAMSLVESSLKPRAISQAQAVGYWQFIEPTGRLYGLRIDKFIDERQDFYKSTKAASRYLFHLYEEFQDWLLSMSAYNMGEGRLRALIKKYGNDNFWKLSKKPDFPKETRDYIPKVLAAAYIMKNPASLGLKDFFILSPHKFDVFFLPGGANLKNLSENTPITLSQLRTLNPGLKKDFLPENIDSYPLRAPKGTGPFIHKWLDKEEKKSKKQTMPYEVLARKFRPKNFLELKGQDSVRQTLMNAVKKNRVYPVLLFTGPRGTGKTSSARILAKTLRCQNKKDLIPCEKCEDCKLIGDSRHMDVIEIDGASNNGVDAVRQLRDTVAYMPASGSWKIYIIDEVHMLSNSAFNALLKTFEEPPAHILFILATTESQKIPHTILSRSQRLDFHLIKPSLIKEQLTDISKKENLKVLDEILWLIAKQAQGSLRDAQSLLDQVITFSAGEDLSLEKATQILGLSDPYLLRKCLKALLQREEKKMIEAIEDLRTKGSDPLLFLQSLLEKITELIFLKKNPENDPELVQASPQEIEQMKKDSEALSYEELHFLFDMLVKGEKDLRLSGDSHLFLEVLLLRFCSAPRLESLLPFSKEEEEINKKEEIKLEEKTEPIKKEQKELPISSPVCEDPSSFSGPEFLRYLETKDKPLAAKMGSVRIEQKSQDHFLSVVSRKFSYLQKQLSHPATNKLLREHLSSFLKSKTLVKLEIILSDELEDTLLEETKKKDKEELLSRPYVSKVKEIFS